MTTQVAIVGPTQSGKTIYLACLLRAAFAPRVAERPIKVRPDPKSRAALWLQQAAMEILRGEVVPATREVRQFAVWADLPGSLLAGLGRESLALTLIDTPGGDCMPSAGSPIHAEVVKCVNDAETLLIVVPADARVRPSDLAGRLRHLTRKKVAASQATGRRYPFSRIAVAMTMAELLVLNAQVDWLARIERLEAKSEIERACGPAFIEEIAALVPPGGDWYSLVSSFGFDPDGGGIPVQAAEAGWRLTRDHAGFRDRWWPYRVFEPLEFLARGLCWRETLL